MLLGHPKIGASWEGFALEQLLRALQPREAYFWSIHGQAELDLLVFHRGRRLGFEFKFADAPQASRSMEMALRDLRLDALTVVYPGEKEYRLGTKISVVPLTSIAAAQKPGARVSSGKRRTSPS